MRTRGNAARIAGGSWLVLAAALLAGAPSSGYPAAVATCSFSSSAATLRIEGDDAAVLREGSRIVVKTSLDGGPARRVVTCAGGSPTVTNTDTIRFNASPAIYQSFTVDLRGGPLAPGATLEDGRSSSEIEIELGFDNRTNSDSGSSLQVVGTDRRDLIRLGRNGSGVGVNLNARRDRSPDVDVAMHVRPKPPPAGAPFVGIETLAAGDRITTYGGAGFDGPLTQREAGVKIDGGGGRDTLSGGRSFEQLDGGKGPDHLRGAQGDDLLRGGGGADVFRGGAGNDELLADDRRGESVDCGGGIHDTARIDSRDAAEGCEAVEER